MRFPRRRTAAAAISILAVLSLGVLPAAAVTAGSRDVAPGDGYDISNFQCGSTLPPAPSFVVIEVEGSPYNRTTSSSCLQSQYAYAATGSAPQYYMYAGDTAVRGGSHTITGVCGSSPTAQCVHDYAAGAAEDAIASVDAAGLAVTPTTWWVDVECSTSSCPDWHVNDGRTDLNQAAIKGYVDGLRTRPDRVAGVGFYSTSYQWGRITGQTNGSPAFGVEGLPVWYATAASDVQAGASQYCGTTGFNGGPVTLVQGAPVTVAAGGDQIDPDLLCQPMIASVTQGALAGSVITASGVGRPGTPLSLQLADSFTAAKPLTTVVTDAAGHWSFAFHLASNGVLTVADPDGTSQSMAIGVVAKVNVSKSRAYGKDKLGHCIDRLDGSTYPYVPGTLVDLRGARDRVIGFGPVRKLGTIGSWMATEVVPCGKTPATTKATLSGIIPGSPARFAADGRTTAIKIPVNKTVGKTAKK